MPEDAADRVSARQVTAIACLTLLAFVTRFWDYGHVGLQHFDEGVYAMGALWTAQPGGLAALDADLLSYAPPGYLLLTGCAMLFFGFPDQPVILVSTLAGVASVPLAAAFAQSRFRTRRGRRHRRIRRAVGSSHRLLPYGPDRHPLSPRLAHRPAGRCLVPPEAQPAPNSRPGPGRRPRPEPQIQRCPGRPRRHDRRPARPRHQGCARPQATGASGGSGYPRRGVALLVYWPWYRFVENHGGYQRLLAHHRGYVDGFTAWPGNLRAQLAQAAALSGGWPWLLPAWLLASLGTLWVQPGNRPRWPLLIALILAGTLALVAIPELPWWFGLFAFPGLAISKKPVARLTAAWWLFMTVLVPLYHPYARLALPLHAAGWVLTAHFLHLLVLKVQKEAPSFKISRAWRVWGLLVLLAAVSNHFLPRPPRPLPALLAPTSTLREELAAHVKGPPPDRQARCEC